MQCVHRSKLAALRAFERGLAVLVVTRGFLFLIDRRTTKRRSRVASCIRYLLVFDTIFLIIITITLCAASASTSIVAEDIRIWPPPVDPHTVRDWQI